MKKGMLITVGTGREGDVASGIAFAVRQTNPEFILFIGTEVSLRDTFPLVLQKVGLSEGQYSTRTTTNENDVDRSSVEYIGYIREIRRKGFSPGEIVVDFTSGTKAMSAGLVAAGLAEEVGTMAYVSGERGDGGRVISGTERMNLLEPNLMMFEAKFRKASDLFNLYQYTGCLALLEDLKATRKPEAVARVQVLWGLAEAYQAWDRFNHETAKTCLDGLTGHPLLPTCGLKRKVEAQKAFLHQIAGGGATSYTVERAVDLRNNADRRAEEGKFDDAVARLYRLLEYMAQVKLYRDHGGLITEDLEVSKLKASLQEKYARKQRPEGKVQIPLVDSFELLSDLDDPLGSRFIEGFRSRGSDLKKVLGLRNRSILAHGFGPVEKEVYQKAAELVDGFMEVAFPSWRDMAKGAAFLRIDGI